MRVFALQTSWRFGGALRSARSASRLLVLALVLPMALLLSACVQEPKLRDEPFGQSVRHMILVQTTDPQREPLGLDGEKALNALDAYRSGDGGDSGSAADALSSGLGELSDGIGIGLGGGK